MPIKISTKNKTLEPVSEPPKSFLLKCKLAALWTVAICLSLTALLIVFSIAFYYVLLYPPLQERILRIAEEKMSEYFLGDITVERFESNLLSYVNLYGIRAIGRSEYGDSAYVGRVAVNYWLPALLNRRVHIISAHISDVRGHVVMEPGNKIMLPILPMRLLDSSYNMLSRSAPPPEFPWRTMRGTPDLYRVIPRYLRQTISDDIPNPNDWPLQVTIGRAQIDGINGVYRDLANDMVGEIRNASATALFYTLDSFFVQLGVPEGSYNSPWWNGAIDTIAATGVVTWTGLDVHSMLFRGSGTHVTGSGYLSYFPDGPWDIRADFITSIRPVSILYEFTPEVGKDGIFEGTASYRGELYDPLWQAQVRGHGIVYSGVTVNAMDVDASYSRDEYGRARIRGNSEFGHFDVNASLLMEDIMFGPEFGGYSASAVLTGLDVNRIFDKFSINFPIPMIGADVQFNAEGTARGNADSVVFEIPAAIDVSAKLRGTHHIDDYVGLNAAIRNGNWILDGSWGLNRVEGRGSLNWTNGAVKGAVNADMPDPSAFVMTFTGERASGRVAAGAEFGMRIDRPEKIAFTADLKGNDIVWRGMLADSIEARISFENGNLHLFDASGYVSGRVDSVMKYFGHDSADGRLEVDFSMRGNFDDLFLNAYIRAWNLHYGQHFLDTLAGFASLESDTLRWSSLYLRGGEGTSMRSIGSLVLRPHLDLITTADLFDEQNNAAGTLSFSGTIKDDVIRAECQAVSVPLALLDPWVPDEHRMTGSVTLTGEFSGTTANPAARVSFRFANPNHSGYTAYSLIGDAVLSDSLVSSAALFRLSSNAEPIELRTRLPFLPSSGWALDETGTRAAFAIAQANDFDISDIVAYFDEQLADWRAVGNASFNVEITNAGDGWNVGGALMIPNGRMRYVPENLNVAGIKLDADFSGTLLEPNVDFTVTTGIAWTDLFRLNRGFIRGRSGLDALEIDSARFVFRNDGVIDISQARLFYIEADSLSDVSIFSAQCSITNLPAAVFSRLVPGIEIQSGTFNGGGAVSVNNGRPLAEGALLLSGLNFALTDINPPIGPIDAGIQLRDSTIQITWVSGGWGARGYLSAHGETHWDTEKFYNMDVRVSGTNLSFELPEVIYVGISDADLRINDRPDGFIVSGRAALGPIPTSYVRDINIIEMIGQTQIGSGIRRAPDPFMESIRLHIDLDLADRMGIDMNLGVLTMDGRVTVSGTAAEPGIVGRVAISEGYVYYIDRKFDIMEGTLFNPDVAAFNPDIRIVATSDVSTFSPTAISEQFLITLTMTGTLEDPVVRFTSDPPLSELDILSILTFGERLGGMGSDLNTRLANIAVQQAIGIGTRRLEKLLNVDRISVTGDVIGAGGPEGDGVTIGTAKRFTDRLNIIYEINTGDQINQKATAQYRLLRNIYLEGQTTGMGENAVSLTFRYSR